MSEEQQNFGLRQAKQAVLDAISQEEIDGTTRAGLSRTLNLLRDVETVALSELSHAMRLAQLSKVLGVQSGKRGVHFQRDGLLVELVVLMALERGLDKSDVTLFQQAGHSAGMSHERSVEKIWKNLNGPAVLASYRAQAEGKKSHWTTDKAVIRDQKRLITNLMSEVALKS